MVVLTLVAQNGETVFFNNPISKVHFIKLLSCSLYNSWDTLKNEGTLSIVESDGNLKVSKIPPGHYTLESLKNTIEENLKIYFHESSADPYSPLGQLVISNHSGDSKPNKPLRIDRDLAKLLGIGRELKNMKTIIKLLVSQTEYYIHCDLVDRNNNLFNGKRSDLLATLDVKGKPYEKVSYYLEQPSRKCSTDSYINSITLSIKDQDGELFDFKGLPIKFELELI